MSIMNNIKMASNMAIGPIMAGARQASSYVRPMGRLGIQVSKEIATSAYSNGLVKKSIIGAGIGAAGGAGYNATGDRATTGSMIRAGIKGAGIGAVGGAAFGLGRAAYGGAGRESMRNLGANARLLGRDMRAIGKNAGTMYSARGLGNWSSMAGMGNDMLSSGLHAYGRGVNAATRAGRRVMGG